MDTRNWSVRQCPAGLLSLTNGQQFKDMDRTGSPGRYWTALQASAGTFSQRSESGGIAPTLHWSIEAFSKGASDE